MTGASPPTSVPPPGGPPRASAASSLPPFDRDADLLLSVVLVSYNMARELPRTLTSLSPNHQRGIDGAAYEVIVVDNGSAKPPDRAELAALNGRVRFVEPREASHSPVGAVNAGIAAARGAIVCACIDAARMASPGLLSLGCEAAALSSRSVAGSLSFHLGRHPQNLSVGDGYDQAIEDDLLRSVPWRDDGYRLFDIGSFDPSSRFGFFSCPAESNALFLTRDMWRRCGGYDAAFSSPGGGLTNLDLWRRLCEGEGSRVTLLLGEGTFHQVHGGTATNARASPWARFAAEYRAVRGIPYEHPSAPVGSLGAVHPSALPFVARSCSSAAAGHGLRRRAIRKLAASAPARRLDRLRHGW